MVLEDFRKIKITLNQADEPIVQKLIAKEGDVDGRELEVQLINQDVTENLESVNLSFYWNHSTIGNQGIEPFEVVDAGKGIFKIAYPEEMLNRGNVICFIQIQDGAKITNTPNFVVVVQGSGFDASAAIASNEYKALTDSLIEINKYKSEIDQIKQGITDQGDDLIGFKTEEIDGLIETKESELNTLYVEKETKLDTLHEEKETSLTALETDFGERAGNLEEVYAPNYDRYDVD